MIPIRDTAPSSTYPVVNLSLIGLNVLTFLFQLSQGPDLDRFVYIYGLVPARYSVPHVMQYFSTGQQVFSFISFMFLHGGFLHLLGNMWFLYIFGDNVEDRLGHLRYLLFYLLCGILSGVSHLMLNLNSNVPTIGASGAIAGVMGAYIILHPHARILTLIPIVFIPWFVEIPAFFFLGLWFLLQFLSATGSHGAVSGIAWWAHIGGFVFGILLLKLFGMVPRIGADEKVRSVTSKRRTEHLQSIRPRGGAGDADMYGTLVISPYEALTGTRKLVNVPWGFHNRLIRVLVPPGVKRGSKLRLQGLGKQTREGSRGDLYLQVEIRG
ncbi:MAG: rhomboid family intramembrane serine protease [Desulfobacteraceae bacterium]|nr:rhomboid family intramembrane serine protease [Desulfobacteraceae bacterium]